MTVFDAHMHFDMTAEDPRLALEEELSSANIEGCNLIVNTPVEKAYLQKLLGEGMLPPKVKCISSTFFRDPVAYQAIRENLGGTGIPLHIKLHPRVENITKNDFPTVIASRELDDAQVIIVDCFPYGPQYKNHIGVELAIEIATVFPQKKIVLAHCGGVRLLECAILTRSVANIMYDTSLTFNYYAGTSVATDGLFFLRSNWEKVLIGSDYPSYSVNAALETILSMGNKAGLERKKMRLILHENASILYHDF